MYIHRLKLHRRERSIKKKKMATINYEASKNPTNESHGQQPPYLGQVPTTVVEDSRVAASVIELIGSITKTITEASHSFTLTPSPTPVHRDPPAAVKVEPMPQTIKKIHSTFYAFITAAVLLLKTTELQSSENTDQYRPLLNYGRIKFIKISETGAYSIDIGLIVLGLVYGGAQVAAQQFRIQGNLKYDCASIYLGALMVSALMFGVSGSCGLFVAVLFVLFMIFLHQFLH